MTPGTQEIDGGTRAVNPAHQTDGTSTTALDMNVNDAGNEQRAHNWKRRCELVYRARLSALYHLKRERFFDGLHRFVFACVFGFALAVMITPWCFLGAQLFLIVQLLWVEPGSRRYRQLAEKFRWFLAVCERAGQHWEAKHCDEFAARLLELEASEPAPLAALVADCQNQLAVASGEGLVADMRLHHHILKHLVDLRPRQLQ